MNGWHNQSSPWEGGEDKVQYLDRDRYIDHLDHLSDYNVVKAQFRLSK